MARIVVGSAFRNSAQNAPRYFERVAALRDFIKPRHLVRVLAVEGDSTDNTREALRISADYHGLPLDLRTCNHGGPVFGSTEQPERMVALSKVGNTIFDGVMEYDDLLIYIESDLKWQPQAIDALIWRALDRWRGFDVFAPMVVAGSAFYDIWGFRGLDGVRWGPFDPMHPDVAAARQRQGREDDGLVEVSSAGSCLVMRAEVARKCRIRNDYCLVGWCEDARRQGYRIAAYLDQSVRQL